MPPLEADAWGITVSYVTVNERCQPMQKQSNLDISKLIGLFIY